MSSASAVPFGRFYALLDEFSILTSTSAVPETSALATIRSRSGHPLLFDQVLVLMGNREIWHRHLLPRPENMSAPMISPFSTQIASVDLTVWTKRRAVGGGTELSHL